MSAPTVKKSPGRPKKYSSLEAATPEAALQQIESTVPPSASAVDLSKANVALGIGKNEKGKWTVYRFRFNPLTKDIMLEEEISEDGRNASIFRFKQQASLTVLRTKD